MIDLRHGDCLELMKDIPDNSIDMVLCDPPYGTTACKWDSVIPFEPMWEQLKRITKDNGAICLFGSEPFSSHLRMSNIKMFKYDWVWHKSKPSGSFTAKLMPMKSHEIVSIFGGKINFYPIKEDRDCTQSTKNSYTFFKKNNKYQVQDTDFFKGNKITEVKDVNFRNPTTVKYFKNVPQKLLNHPTQKPVALLEYLIKTYTLENETVLDFTMGSGSTGVAAKNLNRSFVGIEMDDKYYNIAQNRINLGES